MLRIILFAIGGAIAMVFLKMIFSWFIREVVKGGDGKKKLQKTKALVACSKCGVYVPKTDAISHNRKWYCSAQHQEQDSE
jgi:hypothetical protein